jgi:hypothetical protein
VIKRASPASAAVNDLCSVPTLPTSLPNLTYRYLGGHLDLGVRSGVHADAGGQEVVTAIDPFRAHHEVKHTRHEWAMDTLDR